MTSFTMRSARSGGFIAVIAFAVLLETSGLHLVLAPRHPVIAWTLTLSSIWVLWWLAMDYRAMAATTIDIDADTVRGAIGRRIVFASEVGNVKSVGRPQLMPVSGPPKGYVNATKPAAPNVLITFRSPVTATVLGMPRSISQLALRLDDAEAFVSSLTVR